MAELTILISTSLVHPSPLLEANAGFWALPLTNTDQISESGGRAQTQELAPGVAHIEPHARNCQAISGEKGLVIRRIDGCDLHVDLLVPGDAQLQREGFFRAARSGRPEVSGLVVFSTSCRGNSLISSEDSCSTRLACTSSAESASMAILPCSTSASATCNPRHGGFRGAVEHDALVVQFDAELAVHLAREFDVHATADHPR